MTTDKPRTPLQNASLHVWLKQKADQCREAGVSPRMIFSRTIELEMTPELMKEIFRTVLKALHKKSSTTQMSKHMEYDEVVNHLNRFFAQEFNLEETAIPHDPTKIRNDGLYNYSNEPNTQPNSVS